MIIEEPYTSKKPVPRVAAPKAGHRSTPCLPASDGPANISADTAGRKRTPVPATGAQSGPGPARHHRRLPVKPVRSNRWLRSTNDAYAFNHQILEKNGAGGKLVLPAEAIPGEAAASQPPVSFLIIGPAVPLNRVSLTDCSSPANLLFTTPGGWRRLCRWVNVDLHGQALTWLTRAHPAAPGLVQLIRPHGFTALTPATRPNSRLADEPKSPYVKEAIKSHDRRNSYENPGQP
jgi:hypothetical protein